MPEPKQQGKLNWQNNLMTTQNLKFDRQFYRDLWSLLKPYWSSSEKWSAYMLLFLVIACTVIQVRTNVALNTFYRDFFNALQNFDKHALLHLMLHLFIIVTILILSVGYNVYFTGMLTIRWRRWLTQQYQNSWLAGQTFYKMQILNKNVDNPDQRISEDLDSFPTATVGLFANILNASLTLVSFGYILWTLSGSLSIPLGTGHTLTVPGYLLWSALLYAAIGTWLTATIGKKLALLNYQQQYYNADFRFGLVRVRESSEQIALHRGEAAEQSKFFSLFKRIYDNFIDIIRVQKKLMFFQFGYNALSYIFGLMISMPLYFSKKIQIGGIMQISGAFGEVISSLSLFISLFSSLATWRSVIYRLTEFNHNMQAANEMTATPTIEIKFGPEPDIKVLNLSLCLPDGTALVHGINLTIHPGESVLFSGVAGAGKSTLLRTLAGIWPYGSGQIILPHNKNLMFMPQKPYLPLGTLQDALLYPYQNESITQAELLATLQLCNLGKHETELRVVRNWSHELSLGEQQLIGFCRVFLQKPDFIFLDEATSALDEKAETKLYQKLKELLPNITIISVGHRGTLTKFHEKKLMVTQNGENHLPSTITLAMETI